MSLGFAARDTQDLPFDGSSSQELLAIAVEAAAKLEWSIQHLNDDGFRAFTTISENNEREEINLRIGEVQASIVSESIGEQLIDESRNQENTNDFLTVYAEIKRSSSPEYLLQKIEELKLRIISQPQDENSGTEPQQEEKSFLDYFKPTKGYFISPILLFVNVGLFVLMVAFGGNAFLPENETLLNWGANWKPATLDGEWWRLLTCCFLHIGVLHMVMNMYALVYIGRMLEPRLGTKRFVAAYFLTGIAASVISLWWHDNTISAGASGAIFGLYGVFLAMLTTNLIEKSERMSMLSSVGFFVAYNLFYGLKGGVDNAAHIGGLLSGLIIGYSFYPSLKKNDEPSLIKSISLVSILVLGISFFVCYSLPNDIATYNSRIEEFVELEKEALKVFQMPERTPKGQLLMAIKDKGIGNWEKSITLLDEINTLDLPPEYHKRMGMLIEYCHLRIGSYNLIYKQVAENTEQYKDSLNYYDTKLIGILDEMKEQK
jgi:rhomboid protease GluP